MSPTIVQVISGVLLSGLLSSVVFILIRGELHPALHFHPTARKQLVIVIPFLVLLVTVLLIVLIVE